MNGRAYTRSGVAAAAGGTFLWGIGSVLIKLTTSPVIMVIFYRLLIGIPLLAVVWWFGRDRSLPWRVAGVGGVLFAAHQMAHFSSLRYSTVAVVTIFFSLQPLVVGAAGKRVTGEGTTPRFYLWATIAIVGCAILVLASNGSGKATALGNALAVVNLFLWCAYYLATKRARETVGTLPWLFVMTVVAAACIGAAALIARQPFTPPHGRELALLTALAVGPGTIGHFLVTWAQPRIHAAASSAIIIGVPVVAAIGAALFADEPFTAMEGVGAIIALGGAAIAMRHLPPPLTADTADVYGEATT
jgi:drug/metabolite transporter (DMT)-like permease